MNNPTNLTAELYRSPSRDKNEDKFGVLSGNQCICCMRPMKDVEVNYVHMNEDWKAVQDNVTDKNCKELTGANSQGLFPIGSTCEKKMPKGFIIYKSDKK